METQDIKNMGLAYLQVLEAMKKKKMDKVDADELKGSHADRDDKDIDNDGDADKSDEYLHNRRKAVKAAITKEEVEMDEAVKHDRYMSKHGKKASGNGAWAFTPIKSGNVDVNDEKEVYQASPMQSIAQSAAEAQRHFKKYGVKSNDLYVMESVEIDEAKKMSISAKQIKAALASAKAQAKPKDQVSLKKAPFDIPKESVEVERNWTILNRIQEKAIAPRDMNHVKGATPPEAMDSKESPKAKEFAATSGVPASVTLDANVVAQQTADAIRASAAKISGNSNRSNDQKTGDKNIIKSTMAESKTFTKFRSFFS
jgi:hypothetical protein